MRNIKIILLIACMGSIPMQLFAQNISWTKKSAPVVRETYAVSFSHDGKKVFSGSECGPTYLRIFDAYTGDELWQSQVDSPLMCAQGVKFNSNGSKVATLEELGNLLIYDFTTPQPTLLSTVSLGTPYSFGLAFSPDGNKIATGCSDKKLLIHNANTGTEIHSIDAHANWVTGVDWSVNEQIVTCGDDMFVRLWDSAGNPIRSMAGHIQAVSCVKFTPDGNYIISGSKDKTIRIWETASGNHVRTLNGHTSEIKQIDVSDDGLQVVTGSFDETIRVWDFATGTQTHMFKKDGAGRVFSVDFAPGTNRYIAAGTSNGDVQVWDMLFATDITVKELEVKTHVFPNPCTDVLNINGSSKIEKLIIQDVSGRNIDVSYHINQKAASINTGSLPAGYYCATIFADGNTATLNFNKK